MKKTSTLEKIIRNIQDIEIGGVTSYITISRELGWKTHCGRMLQKDIISVKPEVFEKFRDGRESKIRIVSDPKVLDEILESKESAKKSKTVKTRTVKLATDEEIDKAIAFATPKKVKKTKMSKKKEITAEEIGEEETIELEPLDDLDNLTDDVAELDDATQSTFEHQLNDDDFFNS